ncbi:MAG: NAD-dependent epimerase/dehydratase family protein [Terriglobales bacterium]
MKKVLVTGGSGFLGAVLVRQLVERGDACRSFDILDDTGRPREVEFISGDIRDLDAVRRACAGMDVVLHNVALVPIAKDDKAFVEVNLGGTANLLRACREAGVKKVVYTSSSAIYGVPDANPVTESTVPHPGEAYGRAKWGAEKLCLDEAKNGLDVSIIRPRTILGPGRLGIFGILFEWIRNGQNVPVLGKGDNTFQFVHVEDLARACVLAGDKASPEVFNCGTDRFGTMRELLEAVCRYAGTGSRIAQLPRGITLKLMRLTSRLGLSPLAEYHAMMYGQSMWFDISAAQSQLQWQPKYSNEEMILESYRWYVENRDKLSAHIASHHRSPLRQGILRVAGWLW